MVRETDRQRKTEKDLREKHYCVHIRHISSVRGKQWERRNSRGRKPCVCHICENSPTSISVDEEGNLRQSVTMKIERENGKIDA